MTNLKYVLIARRQNKRLSSGPFSSQACKVFIELVIT